MSAWHSMACTDHTLCIYSAADGHLGCFCLLAAVNKAERMLPPHYRGTESSVSTPLCSVLWGTLAVYISETQSVGWNLHDFPISYVLQIVSKSWQNLVTMTPLVYKSAKTHLQQAPLSPQADRRGIRDSLPHSLMSMIRCLLVTPLPQLSNRADTNCLAYLMWKSGGSNEPMFGKTLKGKKALY